METIKELEKFDGKRNTALTFIIPPNYDYTKDYYKIKKNILRLKVVNVEVNYYVSPIKLTKN
jgi:hypothetical protein